MTYSYFRHLRIFIKLPKYYLKRFQYGQHKEAMKYYPKNIRLDYGRDKYDVELSIWRTYHDVMEIRIEKVCINGLNDCTDDLSSTNDVQGVGRMIRHEIYAIVKSFK